MTTPAHACGHDTCGHGSLAEHRDTSDAVCIDDVTYRYPQRGGGERVALRGVTLHVPAGCNLGIIGPNGAGKSTLIRIVLGLIDGYTGHVTVAGMTPRDACRRGGVIGYVPQRHDAEWRFPLSVRQVVRMGLVGKTGLLRRHSREDLDYAEHIMQRTGVADIADKPIGQLSGGQQQRAFIARALAARPGILLLDEPMVGVDQVGQHQFASLIHDLHESLKLTLIIVSHDLRAIAAGCNRVACLNQTIHYHDAPSGLTQDTLREVFQHEVASLN
jgi:zinc transport system ATP-binding protein